MIVYIIGDMPVIFIQKILKSVNLINSFPTIQNFNLQIFWILCFIFLRELAKFLIIKGSQKYSDKLHESLLLLNYGDKNLIE